MEENKMRQNINKKMDAFVASQKITVKCNKCGLTFSSRLFQNGDKHKAPCGGEFIMVEV